MRHRFRLLTGVFRAASVGVLLAMLASGPVSAAGGTGTGTETGTGASASGRSIHSNP